MRPRVMPGPPGDDQGVEERGEGGCALVGFEQWSDDWQAAGDFDRPRVAAVQDLLAVFEPGGDADAWSLGHGSMCLVDGIALGADELRQVAVTEHLADGMRFAQMVPVVVYRAMQHGADGVVQGLALALKM